ncbi:MAG: carbohydrate ABC transporter permease [Ruminococcaceae bacterium]|nr:carbohydrate ABC transporter permease [Oscillospiraceae bacterium]
MTKFSKTLKKIRQFKLFGGGEIQYKRYTRSKFVTAFFVVALLGFGFICILPLIYCVATSLKPLDEILIFPPKFFVRRPTIANYTLLPSLLSKLKVPLSRYVFNTVFITIVGTVGHILAASAAAFFFSKSKNKWAGIIFMIVQFSLLYNGTTLGVPQYIIFSKMGIIDTYWVYILPHIPGAMGVFLMKQYMDGSVPESLLEAARIDGAGYPLIFWKIVMPMVKPAWLTLLLYAFRDMWAVQSGTTIFTESLKTLPAAMSQITNAGIARSGSAMATTVIMMIPPILVYLISQSNVMETMSNAGMKD